MSRNLLHRQHLSEFIAWLDSEAIPHRNGRGDYEVMQVKIGDHWPAVYRRDNMPEHYSTDRRIDPLIRQFIIDRKGKPKVEPVRKQYAVMVQLDVMATNEDEALAIACNIVNYGAEETAHSIPDSRFIDFSLSEVKEAP